MQTSDTRFPSTVTLGPFSSISTTPQCLRCFFQLLHTGHQQIHSYPLRVGTGFIECNNPARARTASLLDHDVVLVIELHAQRRNQLV